MARSVEPASRSAGASVGVDATIAAYDEVAPEYELPEHVTTRSLERASLAALRAAGTFLATAAGDTVLEVGCGTGAQTGLLAELARPAVLIATDPSPRMLAIARERPLERVRWCEASADEALGRYGKAALVVGTLADPYLNRPLVASLARPAAAVMFTVPSHRWAVRERAHRLGVATERTRFELRDGRQVEVDSMAYDVEGLEALFGDWRVAGTGYELGPPIPQQPRPEVAWIAARPHS